MKSTLLIICFVFVSLIGAFAQSSFYDLLELRPTISNYNGSVVGGSTILVYGDAGTITRSSNGGQSWEKILLGDSLNIIGIVKSGDKFIGLCSKRFGITSQDGGINWSFTDLGEATEYYKIQNINGKIYVLMNGKFVVMSENFSILKQYEFPTDSLYNDFATSDKWALCSAGPGKLASINLENDELNIIDLKGNEICSDCPVPKLLTPYDDGRVVFSLNGDLYDYDFKYTIIQPTVQLQKINGGALTSRDNDLYFIHSRNFPWV
ncbi:MAG: WD40/YVTN/BNR-like repeat-containing protein [Chloroflexota bacterium]